MWESIQKWINTKGGLAHILAAVYTFLIAAYMMDPQFHAYVIHVHQSLPGWAQELIVEGLGLWAFYKNWDKKTEPQLPPADKEAKEEG